MDLHKIIHNTLHEFIKTYITDADLRLAITMFVFFASLQKSQVRSVLHKVIFYPPMQHTG